MIIVIKTPPILQSIFASRCFVLFHKSMPLLKHLMLGPLPHINTATGLSVIRSRLMS